jgi:hypothetical protein
MKHLVPCAAVLASACTAEVFDETGTLVRRGNGYTATATRTADGIWTTLVLDDGSVLIQMHYDEATHTAVASTAAEATSHPIEIDDIPAPMNLETAASLSYAIANPVTSPLDPQPVDGGPDELWNLMCCWWGDLSECGFAWDPPAGGTVCCGWGRCEREQE